VCVKRISVEWSFPEIGNRPVYSAGLGVCNFEGARICNIVFTKFRDWIMFLRIRNLFHTFRYFAVRSFLKLSHCIDQSLSDAAFLWGHQHKLVRIIYVRRAPFPPPWGGVEGRRNAGEFANLALKSLCFKSDLFSRLFYPLHLNIHLSTLCFKGVCFWYCCSPYRLMTMWVGWKGDECKGVVLCLLTVNKGSVWI
jgi:hypothetical protein